MLFVAGIYVASAIGVQLVTYVLHINGTANSLPSYSRENGT
jgi:hypothetical protein